MRPPLETHYRPKEVSELLGITVPNLRLMIDGGKIKAIKTPGGQRRIPESEVLRLLGHPVNEPQTCALYARVSSKKQKDAGHLDRQMERLTRFADERGLQIIEKITDVGSGINENRRGLKRLFKLARDRKVRTVIVEYRDRVTRFGYPYVQHYFALCGVEILVKEENIPKNGELKKDHQQELVEDLIAIVYSYSGKLYGRRSAKFRQVKQCVDKTLKQGTE
ncbi:MAG: IS607 family transposase [Candidatus Hermodarchaeota archaeon]